MQEISKELKWNLWRRCIDGTEVNLPMYQGVNRPGTIDAGSL
jgi:hypothetical protein